VSDCSKIQYLTLQAAFSALHAIQRKSAARGQPAPQAVYPCGRCHSWHLTSKPLTGHPWWQRKQAQSRHRPVAQTESG
jgi:cytochrome c553